MTTDDRIDRGRAAYARKAWAEAFEQLSAADAEAPLALDDLELAGFAAQYAGHWEASVELGVRFHRAAIEAGEIARAARVGFWIGMAFLRRGDVTQGGGWIGRATHLLDEHDLDTVERGYLAVPDGIRQVEADPAAALAAFQRAADYAERFGDANLMAISRLGRGRSLIGLGETERGVAFLDDAMVAVTSDDLSPTVTGIVYCGSIEAFAEIFDLRRAQDWTKALSEWSERQPGLVSFRGRCLVYRSELKRLHGDWAAAFDEARQAQELLLRPPPEPAVGEAYYEQAELHRLRGEYAAAETAYREASQWGRRPEPGLALLLLARGRGPAARAMIDRAVAEAPDDIGRVRLLPTLAQIALATGDLVAARTTVDELAAAERIRPAPMLSATIARLDGELRLAEGSPARRCRRSAGPSRSGASSTRRTTPRACGPRWATSSAGSATRTPRRSSSTPRCGRSASSGRRPTSNASSASPVVRPVIRAGCRTARSRSSGGSRPGTPTGRSRRLWASASGRSTATSATSSPSSACRHARPRPRSPSSTTWPDPLRYPSTHATRFG